MVESKVAPGKVIWITGYSGAGKSTIARAMQDELNSQMRQILLLDGDEFRRVFNEDLGHTPADRLKNAYRIAALARYVSMQGLHVACATMSLFHEVHDWNRENIPNYFEVYLKIDLDTARRRDPKGLYMKRNSNEIGDLVGIDLQAELPKNPHLVIENNEDRQNTIEIARKILVVSGMTV